MNFLELEDGMIGDRELDDDERQALSRFKQRDLEIDKYLDRVIENLDKLDTGLDAMDKVRLKPILGNRNRLSSLKSLIF